MMRLYLLGCGNLCLGIILSVFKGSLLSSLYTGTFRIEATGTFKQRKNYTSVYGVISHNTLIFIVTTVTTPLLTSVFISLR